MKSIIKEDMVINDVIKEHPDALHVFKGYSIDACCGGAFSIKEAAKRHGVPLDKLLISLNQAEEERR
ncbi:MAG: DUF542 domain-containing protein [Nitrospirota bacterium]